MATRLEIREHLGLLSTILWNYGADFPVPALDDYESGDVGFSFSAALPGWSEPPPAMIKLAEIWEPTRPDRFTRVEYAYDFIDYPIARRRAFHGHDPAFFGREHGVLIHEHCEERLGFPECSHYHGLPITGFEAIRQFASLWGQTTPLGCADLRCMS
jgi:hypothetical protein